VGQGSAQGGLWYPLLVGRSPVSVEKGTGRRNKTRWETQTSSVPLVLGPEMKDGSSPSVVPNSHGFHGTGTKKKKTSKMANSWQSRRDKGAMCLRGDMWGDSEGEGEQARYLHTSSRLVEHHEYTVESFGRAVDVGQFGSSDRRQGSL